MQVKYILEPIFWRDGINFPSPEYFNNFISSNQRDGDFKVNFIDFKTVNIAVEKEELPTLFWFLDTKTRQFIYYSLHHIQYPSNNISVGVYTLDLYSTYIVDMISWSDFGNTKLRFIRNPILEDLTTLYNDPLITDLVITGDYSFDKQYFIKSESMNGDEKTIYWAYQNGRIEYLEGNLTDVVNGCLYFVFKGDDANYLYIPVFSKTRTCFYGTKLPENEREYTVWFNKLLDNTQSIQNASQIYYIDTDGQQKYIDYAQLYQEYTAAYNGNLQPRLYTCRNDYVNRSLTPENFNEIYRITATTGTPYNADYRTYWYFLSNYFFNYSYGLNFTKQQESDYFKVVIPAAKSRIWTRTGINNSFLFLSQMQQSIEFSNKFVGLFFLPHSLYLQEYWREKTINFNYNNVSYSQKSLVVEFPPEGINVPEHDIIIGNYASNIVPTLNNDTFNNYYLLKYTNSKYYNNNIDLSLFYKNGSFRTSGYLNFTGAANYIDKLNGFSIANCIWTMPYQLPTGADNYAQYIASNYNTTNTSIQIAKQNLITNLITSSLGLVGSAASIASNPVGGTLGTVSALTGIGQTATSYFQQQKMLNSQFADARNQYGGEVVNSMASDAAWMLYYLKDNEQYDGIERLAPNKSSIMAMNNIIYFYSYYSPQFTTFGNMLNDYYNWDCIYLQLDIDDAGPKIDLYINKIYPFIPIDFKNDIQNIFISGLRLWNKSPFDVLKNGD